MIQLRQDDQQPFVDSLRFSLASLKARNLPQRVFARAECGFGKAVCLSYIAGRAASRGIPVHVTVHRKELVDQLSQTLRMFEIPHGIIAAGYAGDPRHLVQLSSIFSVVNRLDRTRKPGLFLVDEGHHARPGTTWGDVIDCWDDTPSIAFSASPDYDGLGEIWHDMVEGPSARWLIENGRLNPYRLFTPGGVDASQLHKRAGEFVAGEVEEITMRPRIVGDVISHYERNMNGAPTVAFCVSVKAAHQLAEAFRQRGWKAAAVDGKMEDAERDSVIRDTRNSALNVTTSCQLIGEGLDVGSLIGAILLNPTMSLSKHVQESMRPLRAGENKPISVINDHVGNCERHGYPDADRKWRLKPAAEKRRKATETPVRQCEACYRTLPAAAQRCPCGHVFEAQAREVEHVEGELTEVDVLAQRRAVVVEQARARSMDDLIAVGIKRGMAKPQAWAAHVMKAREEKTRREAEAMAERFERGTGT